MDSSKLYVTNFFLEKHIFLEEEWLQAVIEHLQQQRTLSDENLAKAVFEQWIYSDISQSTHPSFQLPQPNAKTIDGIYAFQITSVYDIGSSVYSQYRATIHKADNFDFFDVLPKEEQPKEMQFEKKANRMLLFELSDGHNTVRAIEYRPIPQISSSIMPGAKILLYGTVQRRNNILWLISSNCQLLGGDLDTLYQANRKEAFLGRKLKIEKYKSEAVVSVSQINAPSSSLPSTSNNVAPQRPRMPVVENVPPLSTPITAQVSQINTSSSSVAPTSSNIAPQRPRRLKIENVPPPSTPITAQTSQINASSSSLPSASNKVASQRPRRLKIESSEIIPSSAPADDEISQIITSSFFPTSTLNNVGAQRSVSENSENVPPSSTPMPTQSSHASTPSPKIVLKRPQVKIELFDNSLSPPTANTVLRTPKEEPDIIVLKTPKIEPDIVILSPCKVEPTSSPVPPKKSRITDDLDDPMQCESPLIKKFNDLKLVTIEQALNHVKFSVGPKKVKINACLDDILDPFKIEDGEWTMMVRLMDETCDNLDCYLSHQLLTKLVGMTPDEAQAIKKSSNLAKRKEGTERIKALDLQLARLDLVFEIQFFGANRTTPRIVDLETLSDALEIC